MHSHDCPFAPAAQTHVDRTGSVKGKAVLENWEEMLPKFWQLVPPAEKNTPEVGTVEPGGVVRVRCAPARLLCWRLGARGGEAVQDLVQWRSRTEGGSGPSTAPLTAA